jgi:hypothetical protein
VRDAPPALITGERDLPGHLKGEHEKDKRTEKAAARDSYDDYALSEALNLLKGLAMQHKTMPPNAPAQVAEKKANLRRSRTMAHGSFLIGAGSRVIGHPWPARDDLVLRSLAA